MKLCIVNRFLLIPSLAFSALSYQKPDTAISNIVNAESFPSIRINAQKTYLLKAYYNSIPPIDYVATPKLRLAGLRFLPSNKSKFRSYFYTRLTALDLNTKKTFDFKFPKKSRIGSLRWSPNGNSLAISVYKENCVELWIGNIKDKTTTIAREISAITCILPPCF